MNPTTTIPLLLLTALQSSHAFTPTTTFTPRTTTTTSTSLQASLSRVDFLKTAGVALAGGILSPSIASAETTATGVAYEIKKSGDGPKPEVGELVAIRFKATCGANVIDDIFETSEPYYTRLGSGGLIKGVEQVLPMMRVGDRWELTVPGDLAFGKKGRPASAGKPRIPGDATIIFDVEMVGLPGKEQELIDIIGDV